jgi:hypothetical protein
MMMYQQKEKISPKTTLAATTKALPSSFLMLSPGLKNQNLIYSSSSVRFLD